MATSTFRNKNKVRPRKTGATKRRRCLVQRRRLVAMGMDEATVAKMPVDQLRIKLKAPKKLAAIIAKAGEAKAAEA